MGQLIAESAAREGERRASHRQAVRAMFDRISPTYDLLNRTLSWGLDRRWRHRALSWLGDTLPEGPLLDSCAGTLDLAAAMRARWPERTLVGADFARDMLVAGRAKLDGAALVSVCDAERLPFADGAFAGVVCGFGMRNLGGLSRGIAEAHRVLKPGGVFLALEFFAPTRWSTHAFHGVYGRGLLPLVGTLMSGDAEAYRYLSRSMLGFVTRAEFEAALGEAGFGRVDGCDLTFGVASLVRGIK